jgi:hypothetical protein
LSNPKKIILKTGKWLGIILVILISLFVALVLLIRSEWGQNKVVSYATAFVADKTGTTVAIDRLYLTFRGNVQLEGLYLEDTQQDTLVYLKSLEAGVGIKSLLNNHIAISRIDLQGLRANVLRGTDSTFNFNFLIDAFASADTTTTPPAADTSSSPPPTISIGPVGLKDIQLHYLDSISGMQARLQLGHLGLTTDELDIAKMKFKLDELLLENTKVRVVQFFAPPPSQDTAEATLPYIGFNNLAIKNTELTYISIQDTIDTRARIGHFAIGSSEVDLSSQNINIESISLLQSDIRLQMPAPTVADTSTGKSGADSAIAFNWPQWQIELDDLLMDENNITFTQGSKPAPYGQFSPSHIGLSNLHIELKKVFLKNKQAGLQLEHLALSERSGFTLQKLALEFLADNQTINVKNLHLATAHSEMNAQLSLAFPSIDSLIAHPQKHARFGVAFGQTSLSIKDAYYFADSLRYDSLLQNTEDYPLHLSGSASGSYSNIAINNFKANWLSGTLLMLNGKVTDIQDSTRLSVNFDELNLNTTANDLGLLLQRKNPEESLPAYVKLQSNIKGNARKIVTRLDLSTSDGYVNFDGTLLNLLQTPSYKGTLKADTLKVGKFAQNPSLQPVSLTLDFDGRGNTLNNLVANARINFRQLLYNDYNYQNLKLTASVKEKNAQADISFTDENLDFDLNLEALLDTLNTTANLSLNLRGADLKDLNLQPNPMKVAANVNASFNGNADDFSSKLTVKKGIVVLQDQSYRLDSVFASLTNAPNRTDLRVNSEIISGSLKGNTSLQNLLSSLQSYQKQMMSSDSTLADTAYKNLDMSANFIVVNSPIISEVFLPELERLDTVRLSMAFKPSADILKINLNAPGIDYGESELNRLFLDLDATPTATNVQFGFDRVSSGPVDIYATLLQLNYSGNQGSASLSIKDAEDEDVFYTAVDIAQSGPKTSLKVGVEKLILNSKPWSIPASNQIDIEPDLTRFTDFELTRNGQKIAVQSVSEGEKEKMKLAFSNFNLESLFSILNAGNSPVSGTLGGNVVFNDITGTPAFVADVSLTNLGAMGQTIGTLNLQANNKTANQYEVDLTLTGDNADLALAGKYAITGESQNLDLNLNINKINLSLIEGFVPEQLSNTSGYLTGNFEVSGSAAQPQYAGALAFKNVALTSVFLGSAFTLGNEKINLDNDGVYLNNFTINDAANNTLVLNGDVGLTDMLNPTFNLTLKANKFQALNSTREDNDLVYGKVLLNLDVDVQGDMNLPKVNASVGLVSGTEINYIVPATQAQIQERQGIVRFANMKDSTDIISTEEVSTQTITGLDVTAYLKVDPKTTFNIIIDEQSGDKLTITGKADLNYSLSPNGNMNLSGSYELSDGSYQLNLYELVKKKFEITPGSRIVWSGDPMDAELKLTAVYRVETSAADLMAYQVTEQGATVTKYNQKLPFEVLLNINGTIQKPEISFGLDMPDGSKDAIGGSVYRRVQQLEEDESELNKQVFALIVFNRFLPSDASDGSGGGTEQIARSSVSKLLSGQLNKLSEKYIEGFELNFDLDSYEDYQTGAPEQRTDLNVSLRKSLFGDRVVVQVGSTVGIEGEERSNDIIGDISLEYLLTEEGQYRLKPFRKNQFQDLVEGQVTITGLSILFNKEFDTFKELMEKQKEKENKPENTGKK